MNIFFVIVIEKNSYSTNLFNVQNLASLSLILILLRFQKIIIFFVHSSTSIWVISSSTFFYLLWCWLFLITSFTKFSKEIRCDACSPFRAEVELLFAKFYSSLWDLQNFFDCWILAFRKLLNHFPIMVKRNVTLRN